MKNTTHIKTFTEMPISRMIAAARDGVFCATRAAYTGADGVFTNNAADARYDMNVMLIT